MNGSQPLPADLVSKVVSFSLEEIQDLIGDGEADRALRKLLGVARDVEKIVRPDSSLTDDVLILMNNHRDIVKNYNDDEFTYEEYTVSRNQCLRGALQIARDMKSLVAGASPPTNGMVSPNRELSTGG